MAEHGPVVLVAEDHEDLREHLGLALREAGFQALLAGDGREALELFRQHRQQVRVVLSDVQMPHLSGRQLLAALRQDAPDLPVCLMSTAALEGLVAAGAARFFRKPLRMGEVVQTLRELAGER